jgi:iron-sulfur cluster insertion protein
LEVTKSAALEIKNLLKNKKYDDYALHIYIADIERNGIKHGLSLDNTRKKSDEELYSNGIRIYMNPDIKKSLENARIDYIDNEVGKGFIIRNPKSSGWGYCCSC